MEKQEEGEAWSIGALAAASGLPIKTIRFYSDAGLLPPHRTAAGHRRYQPGDLARLQLIRGLRSLDVDLSTVRHLLENSTGLQEAMRGHAKVLRVRLNALRRQLAVAEAAADASPERTLTRLHALTRLEAAERDQLFERFWADVLAPVPGGDADWFRTSGIPQLPTEPTAEQLDAWLELAQLAADPDFRQAAAASAGWFWHHVRPDVDAATWQRHLEQVMHLARRAEAAGVIPSDPAAWPVADAYVAAYAEAFGRQASPGFACWLHQQLALLTEPRVERWWHLIAVVQPAIDGPDHSPDTITWLHQVLGHKVAAASSTSH